MTVYRKKNSKIAKYRRPMRLNIGVVVFGAIFIYMIVSILLYATSSHVSAYEVKKGSLSKDNTYTALAIREEEVFYTEQSGYVTYYAAEGQKVSVGSNVYTIDETGKATESIRNSALAKEELSTDDLTEVQSSIEAFSKSFDTNSFDSVYDFKNTLDNKVLELINSNYKTVLEENSSNANFKICTTAKAGVFVSAIDGMENTTAEEVSLDMFQEKDHLKQNLRTSDLVKADEPVYKLITSEQWSMVIAVNEEIEEELVKLQEESSTLKLQFTKDKTDATAGFEILKQNGGTFVKLNLSNAMIRYARERYIDIKLSLNSTTGLKIPNSAIVEKSFYLVPESYVQKGGNSNDMGINIEIRDKDGNLSIKFIPVELYKKTEPGEGEEAEYYLSAEDLSTGDTIIQLDSNESYQIGKEDKLRGVYNVNKGYAVFKQIQILYENKEYCIVSEGTAYGLALYDHIVLDGTTVEENDIVY